MALQTVCGISAESIYFAGDDGIVIHYTPDVAECEDDGDCEEGYECVEGTCEPIQDDNAALTIRAIPGSGLLAGIADLG